MATFNNLTSYANTVKKWEREIRLDPIKYTQYAEFIGSGITIATGLKGVGDRVTYELALPLISNGQTEGESSDGNEEALSVSADSMAINELYNSVIYPAKGSITQQRIGWDLPMANKKQLQQWQKEMYDIPFFQQGAGNTAQVISVSQV